MHSEKDRLNIGLDELLTWGPRLGMPYQPRLLERLPELNPEEAAQIEHDCLEAQSFVYEQAARVYREELAQPQAEKMILEQFAWISPENLSHAFYQGVYYEWHG
jgi:hypothetical protein